MILPQVQGSAEEIITQFGYLQIDTQTNSHVER